MAAKRNGFVDGNFFLELCNAEEKSLPIASGYCSGYIAAVADLDNGTCSPNDNSNFQLPSNSTQSQLKKVVLNWLNQHPEKLHFGAAGLVEIALSENFPCK